MLIAALMAFASLGKFGGSPQPEVLENLRKLGLEEQLRLIGGGELITAVLLVIPWTASLGGPAGLGFLGRDHRGPHGAP